MNLILKIKTIELIIETELTNEEILELFNKGTENSKDFGVIVKEIRVKNSANSIIKGINYENP